MLKFGKFVSMTGIQNNSYDFICRTMLDVITQKILCKQNEENNSWQKHPKYFKKAMYDDLQLTFIKMF